MSKEDTKDVKPDLEKLSDVQPTKAESNMSKEDANDVKPNLQRWSEAKSRSEDGYVVSASKQEEYWCRPDDEMVAGPIKIPRKVAMPAGPIEISRKIEASTTVKTKKTEEGGEGKG
ncbi:uncharacterized protein LOC116604406 isoform X2 [Nematostella vectensis]|uniref:uncharacterized protein LOC116604406 isoform X2 n=1 Tax=Nematostella vectensis TaxID=45351 RepID=UPI002077212F|nr:uncharacterized protein LOC116604406 isoform X2 [Nematostella vectensis]